MDSVRSIHTYFLEEAIKGSIDLHIMKIPNAAKKSLEMELISKGYSSMQNKLKHYLLQRQAAQTGKTEVPELSEQETYHIITEVKKLCVARTGAEEGSAVSDALERHISYCFEESDHKTVYFYPSPPKKEKKEKSIGAIMQDAIAEVSKELYETQSCTDTQRRRISTLLTQKNRKQSGVRQDLIRAAYRLKMNLEETNEFLTKAAFTYALDYTDPWELKAAYLIACDPVGEDDSPMILQSKMSSAVPTEEFLYQIQRKEFIRWANEYRSQCTRGRKEEFLLEWAWKCMVQENPEYAKKSFYTKQSAAKEQAMNEVFSKCVAHMESLAAEIDSSKIIPQTDLTIVECYMQRQNRLLEWMYAAAGDPEVQSVVLYCARDDKTFVPFFKEYGFTQLDRSLQKIADPKRALSRSDIISLGIELGLNWEQLNEALETGGFYKLYVKDLHEQALAAALTAHARPTAEQIWDEIQQRYNVLSNALQKKMIKSEPDWVGRIKDVVSTSQADH